MFLNELQILINGVIFHKIVPLHFRQYPIEGADKEGKGHLGVVIGKASFGLRCRFMVL